MTNRVLLAEWPAASFRVRGVVMLARADAHEPRERRHTTRVRCSRRTLAPWACPKRGKGICRSGRIDWVNELAR